MDVDYDVIVCGTGLKECIISGLLSSEGKKVLHVDRNPYYGGESASLNITTLYEKFRPGIPPKIEFGKNRHWNVDLIPKFVMADGKLVKILLKTKVTNYLEWQVIEGTYVYQQPKAGFFFSTNSSVFKVPSTATEVMLSGLMGLREKNSCRSFFAFCSSFDRHKPETWNGLDPQKCSMEMLFKHYNLQANTIDFIGHSVALYTSDDYLTRNMCETIDRIKLYFYSIARYGKSPFLYPVYGLGGLPEGFSRLSAIHGGTYMLNKPVKKFLYTKDGKVCGIETEDGESARCGMIVCDPSYILDDPSQRKVVKAGRVARCICILDQPIPQTSKASSCQIIIPQKQLGRKNDIYIMLVSSTHGVALQGKYIAIVSTTVETSAPDEELAPALKLLGEISEAFLYVSDLWERIDDGSQDNVFVSNSFDATSHFESATDDVLKLWKLITGSDLDLSPKQVVPEDAGNEDTGM